MNLQKIRKTYYSHECNHTRLFKVSLHIDEIMSILRVKIQIFDNFWKLGIFKSSKKYFNLLLKPSKGHVCTTFFSLQMRYPLVKSGKPLGRHSTKRIAAINKYNFYRILSLINLDQQLFSAGHNSEVKTKAKKKPKPWSHNRRSKYWIHRNGHESNVESARLARFAFGHRRNRLHLVAHLIHAVGRARVHHRRRPFHFVDRNQIVYGKIAELRILTFHGAFNLAVRYGRVCPPMAAIRVRNAAFGHRLVAAVQRQCHVRRNDRLAATFLELGLLGRRRRRLSCQEMTHSRRYGLRIRGEAAGTRIERRFQRVNRSKREGKHASHQFVHRIQRAGWESRIERRRRRELAERMESRCASARINATERARSYRTTG